MEQDILKWIPAANFIFLLLGAWYASILGKLIERMDRMDAHINHLDNRIIKMETACQLRHSMTNQQQEPTT